MMDLRLKDALVCRHAPQPPQLPSTRFRAGDLVEVSVGSSRGERWRIAVYDPSTDVAWFLGHPCTMIIHASEALSIVGASTLEIYDDVRTQVGLMSRDDPRRRAHDRILLGDPS